jgi:hypothetical protein
MKMLAAAETFDGGHRFIGDAPHRSDARTMGLAVDQDSAGTALTFAAAILTAGEVELFAEYGEECGILLDFDTECLTVEEQGDVGRHTSTSNKKRVRRQARIRNPWIQRGDGSSRRV